MDTMHLERIKTTKKQKFPCLAVSMVVLFQRTRTILNAIFCSELVSTKLHTLFFDDRALEFVMTTAFTMHGEHRKNRRLIETFDKRPCEHR